MEDINKISISPNDDKRVKSFDSIETYAYGASKVIISKKEEIRCSNRNLISGGSGSRKTNSLFNLIYNPADIEKIYLYAKDLNEGKYQFSIKKT